MQTFAIIMLALSAAALTGLTVWGIMRVLRSDTSPKALSKRMHIKDAADVSTGRMVNEGNYFRGLSGITQETVVVGNGTLDTLPQAIYFTNLNTGDCVLQAFGSSIILGRLPGSGGYQINDSNASREHAVIYKNAGQFVLRDNHSANHTYLNGHIADTDVVLRSGDTIKIGRTKIQISW